jgi:hypothetical protein
MSKRFRVILDTQISKYNIFGFIYIINEEYFGATTHTVVGFYPPQKLKEGVEMRLWGYKSWRESNE